MQLVGTPERATLDLNALRALGVRLVGRLAGIRDGTAPFSGSLPNICALADLKLGRLLDTIDGWATLAGIGDDQPPRRFAPTEVPAPAQLSIDLRAGEIASIVWATGYRPELSWLHVPVLDRKGRIVHDGGITAAPGLRHVHLAGITAHPTGAWVTQQAHDLGGLEPPSLGRLRRAYLHLPRSTASKSSTSASLPQRS